MLNDLQQNYIKGKQLQQQYECYVKQIWSAIAAALKPRIYTLMLPTLQP